MQSPALAADIRLFMAILFAERSSSEIRSLAPAFMKREVTRIMRVPATRRLILLAKKVRLEFCLYILKMRIIWLFVRFLNCGKSFLNLLIFALLISNCFPRSADYLEVSTSLATLSLNRMS